MFWLVLLGLGGLAAASGGSAPAPTIPQPMSEPVGGAPKCDEHEPYKIITGQGYMGHYHTIKAELDWFTPSKLEEKLEQDWDGHVNMTGEEPVEPGNLGVPAEAEWAVHQHQVELTRPQQVELFETGQVQIDTRPAVIRYKMPGKNSFDIVNSEHTHPVLITCKREEP